MQKTLKLNKLEGLETQGFAKNANSYYKGQGLKGHTGIDYVNGWKSDIKAVCDGLIYAVKAPTKNTEKYTAVYQLVDTDKWSYEVSYGHINDLYVKVGDKVKVGKKIATEGNFGVCYRGGKKVTPSEKKLGWGSHLHFQVRKCKRVKKIEKGKKYLRNSEGYFKKDGLYYEIVNYNNGYNGCVPPNLFFELSVKEILNFILLLKKIGILK